MQKLPPALIKVSLKHVTIFTSIQRYQITNSRQRSTLQIDSKHSVIESSHQKV